MDIEEGEIVISDVSSDEEDKRLWKDDRPRERTFNASRSDQLSKHSCHKGSICSHNFQPEDCYVSHLRRSQRVKEDQSRITTTFIQETRQMRASRSGSFVSYRTTNEYSWQRDSNSKSNKHKKKPKPVKNKKQHHNNGGRVSEYASIMEPLYKKKKSRSAKKNSGQAKRVSIVSQNTQCTLMNKLSTAGLIKRTSSSTISSLQEEVGSTQSLCSINHDRSETSTISSVHAEVGSPKYFYNAENFKENDSSSLVKSENSASCTVTNEDSDSEIEVIIPPKKIPLVVTLDSDGEELGDDKGDGATENNNDSHSLVHMDEINHSECINQSVCTNTDLDVGKDEKSAQNDSNTFSDSSILCVDDELPTYSPSSPSSCSINDDNEPYSPSVGPVIETSYISHVSEPNECSNTNNHEALQTGLTSNSQHCITNVFTDKDKNSCVNHDNENDVLIIECASEQVESGSLYDPFLSTNMSENTGSVCVTICEDYENRGVLSSLEETSNVVISLLNPIDNAIRNDDLALDYSRSEQVRPKSPDMTSSIRDGASEQAYSPSSDYDKVMCSGNISVTSSISGKAIQHNHQSELNSDFVGDNNRTDNDLIKRLDEKHFIVTDLPNTSDRSDVMNNVNEPSESNNLQNKDTGIASSDKPITKDEEDDISQLRLIALSTKGKLKSGSSNENVSQSNTSADDDDNNDDDVLQLRVAALKSAVIKKHEERKKRGFLCKKRKHTSSGPGEDLFSISVMSESVQVVDEPPQMEIATPISPPLSTKSLQGEEDMEIADSDSGGDIIQEINVENHKLEDSAECETALVRGADVDYSKNEHLPLSPVLLPPPPPPPLLFPSLLPPPPPPPLPCSSNLIPLQPVCDTPASLSDQLETDLNIHESIIPSNNFVPETLCKPYQNVNIQYNTSESDRKSSAKRGQMRENLKTIALVENVSKNTINKRKPRTGRKLNKKSKASSKLLCITNSPTSNSEKTNKIGLMNKSNTPLCMERVTGKDKLPVLNSYSNKLVPLCTTANSLVVDNWADCDEFNESVNRHSSKNVAVKQVSSGDVLDTPCDEKAINDEIDLSNMIVLDEIGLSPERKQTYDVGSSVDQDDEEALRLKALTSLPRSQSNGRRNFKSQSRSEISGFKHDVNRESRNNIRNESKTVTICRSKDKHKEFENLVVSRRQETNDKYRLTRVVINEPRRSVVQAKETLKVVIPSDSSSMTMPHYPSPPVVERFVIKVGQDSDSEDDGEWMRRVRIQDSPATLPPGPVVDHELERSIDMLLMNARQSVENGSFPKQVTPEQKSVSSNPRKAVPKFTTKSTKEIDDWDTPLRLLPKERQEEYQRLKKIIEEKERDRELQLRRNKSMKKSQSPLQNVLINEANKVNQALTRTRGYNDKPSDNINKKANVRQSDKLIQSSNSSAKPSDARVVKLVGNHGGSSTLTSSNSRTKYSQDDLEKYRKQNESIIKKSVGTMDERICETPACHEGDVCSSEASIISTNPVSSREIDNVRNETIKDKRLACEPNKINQMDSELQESNYNQSNDKINTQVNYITELERKPSSVIGADAAIQNDLVSSALTCESVNEVELLAKNSSDLVSERFILIDELDELSDSLSELEQKQTRMNKSIAEIDDLRRKLAEAEQRLKAEYSSAQALEENINSVHKAADVRHANIERLEVACCSKGFAVHGPQFKLQNSGKKLMDKKVIQIKDKITRAKQRRNEIMKFIENPNDQEEAGCIVNNKSSLPEGSAPSPISRTDSCSLTNESLEHPRLSYSGRSSDDGISSASPNTVEFDERSCLARSSDLPQSSDKVDDKNSQSSVQLSLDGRKSEEEISESNCSKKRSIGEVCNDPDDCGSAKRLNCVETQMKNTEPSVADSAMDENSQNQMSVKAVDIPTQSSTKHKKSLLRYKSVLQHRANTSRGRMETSSASGETVICPFDLTGKCQDTHCRYQHLS